MLTERRLWLFGLALLAAGWGTYAYRAATPGPYDRGGVFKGADYRHFYVLGRLALERRGGALYDERQHVAVARAEFEPRRSDSFGRPAAGPQVALLFAPLATLPYFPSLLLFSLLSAGMYAACCLVAARHAPALRRHGPLAAVLLAANPAFVALIAFGQVSALALAAMTMAAEGWRRRAPILAGAGVGLLCYKPTLALAPVMLMLLTGQFRALAIAAAVGASQLAIGAAWFGVEVLPAYVRSLLSIAGDPAFNEPHPELLHSFTGFFNLLLGRGSASTLLAVAASVAAVAVLVRCWRRLGPAPEAIGALCVVTVLVAPHLTTYDLVVLVPGLLPLAARRWPPGDRTPLWIAGVYVAPILSAALGPGLRLQPSTVLLTALLAALAVRAGDSERVTTDTSEVDRAPGPEHTA